MITSLAESCIKFCLWTVKIFRGESQCREAKSDRLAQLDGKFTLCRILELIICDLQAMRLNDRTKTAPGEDPMPPRAPYMTRTGSGFSPEAAHVRSPTLPLHRRQWGAAGPEPPLFLTLPCTHHNLTFTISIAPPTLLGIDGQLLVDEVPPSVENALHQVVVQPVALEPVQMVKHGS